MQCDVTDEKREAAFNGEIVHHAPVGMQVVISEKLVPRRCVRANLCARENGGAIKMYRVTCCPLWKSFCWSQIVDLRDGAAR